ncbi:MAG: dephospho-CoA kinase [Alphaproteobacteria bacterium]
MRVLGLTGSIGMGKSTAARFLRYLGVPVVDSDATVHRLFATGGRAVPKIAAAFPSAVKNRAVDRVELSRLVTNDTPALKRLEAIVHPMVAQERDRFLQACALRGAKLVVLDIPLLFEGGLEKSCDATIVVSAPAHIQRLRVLARPNMSPEKFRFILSRQISDVDKRRRADYVIPSNQGMRATLLALRRVVRAERSRPSRVWPAIITARRNGNGRQK